MKRESHPQNVFCLHFQIDGRGETVLIELADQGQGERGSISKHRIQDGIKTLFWFL